MSGSIKKWSWSFIFCVVALLSATPVVRAEEIESDIKAVTSLSEALPIEDVLVLLDQYQVRPLMLESDFRVGGENVHDFYLDLTGKPADGIKSGYEEARRSFLEDMLRLNASATAFPDYVRGQQREMQNVLRIGNYREIQVSKVTVKGRSQDVERFVLRESSKIDLGKIAPGEDSRRKQIRKPTIITEPATVVESTWYPNSGTSATDQSTASERYVIQFMKWTNVSFGADETYEHDFRLYNYENDGTYFTLDTNFYPDCLPAVVYASTTWPVAAKPYLDTRFDGLECEDDEPAYTMGTARASALASEIPYQTYISLRNGNVDQDKFKLWAQRGHRFPSWCDDTWCSYSDEFVILVPAWGNEVPGIVNWTKPAPSLSVSLTASPNNGPAPLNDVDLTATVSGSATGTINYTFYCNRSDNGTNITSGYATRYTGISANPKTAVGVCDYPSPGTYTAKVIVERGSAVVEARTTVTVSSSGGSAPAIVTLAATSVTQASVTFNATVNPNGSEATFWFDYGTNTSMDLSSATHTLSAATSLSAVSISQAGLICNKTYYFRIRAINAAGNATPGDILSFTTDPCGSGGPQSLELVVDPSFEAGNNAWWVTSPAFYIDDEFDNSRTGDFYAYLTKPNGTAGDNLSGGMISPTVTIPSDATDADLRFYYSVETQETNSSSILDYVDVYLVRSGNQTKVATISNLDHSGTTYVSKSLDLSSSFYGDEVQIFFAGFTNGTRPTKFRIDDVSLEVDVPNGGPPDVTTLAADRISASRARLNMEVDPNGADTVVWFDLEANDPSPDDGETERLSVGSGSQTEDVSISVFDLECDTLYYFRANADNDHDSDRGNVRSFRTAPCSGGAPHADTDPAENVTQTSAVLIADVEANGLSTWAWFAWGTSPSLNLETPRVNIGSGVDAVDFAQTLSGLSCGTTYYFENRAENALGQDDGNTHSFRTTDCSIPPPTDEIFLFASSQACAGTQPAVLLGWAMPAEADNLVTIRRLDGQYVATVNTAIKGPVHLIESGLAFGTTYRFTVEAQVEGSTVTSNEIIVPIVSDECRLSVAASDRPHPPLLWADPPFCENGVAKVRLHWTEASGATSYSLQRSSLFTPNANFDSLTDRSFVDVALPPGSGHSYEVTAHNGAGSVSSSKFGVLIPGTVCDTAGSPGPFYAGVDDAVCDGGTGAMTVHWSQSAGAAPGYRLLEFYGHRLQRGDDYDDDFGEELSNLQAGIVARVVVQAESGTASDEFREAHPMAKLVPVNVCGASSLRPLTGGEGASYIRAGQALVTGGVIPNGADTTVYLQWGTNTTYGFETTPRMIGNGFSAVTLGEVLSGLVCGTTYHFRTVATNANGTTQGGDKVFTTLSCASTLPIVGVFAVDNYASEAGLATGTFRLLHTGDGSAPLVLSRVLSGTATNGIDYEDLSAPLVIPAGSGSIEITVRPKQDTEIEPDETVVLTLLPQSHYEIGSAGSATVTITSDDVGCSVSVGGKPVGVGFREPH